MQLNPEVRAESSPSQPTAPHPPPPPSQTPPLPRLRDEKKRNVIPSIYILPKGQVLQS